MKIRVYADGTTWQYADEQPYAHMSDDFEVREVPDDATFEDIDEALGERT